MMDTLTKKLQSVNDDINTFVCDKHADCKTCPFFRPKRDCAGSVIGEAYREAVKLENRLKSLMEAVDAIAQTYGLKE